jgi:hypothetical protein
MPHYEVILWSVGSVLMCGMFLALFARRHRIKPTLPAIPPDRESPVPETSEHWEPMGPDPRGRRKAYRRSGNHTLVHLIGLSDTPVPAWVLNRSSGGLGLALDRPVAVGRSLLVLPIEAPSGTPPVEILVRWCNRRTGGHEVGCQFTARLSPRLLLLFG